MQTVGLAPLQPRRAPLARMTLFASLLFCWACDPLCRVTGHLVAPPGATASTCTVKLHHPPGAAYGVPCYLEGEEDYEASKVISVGQRFRCDTIPSVEGTLLQVSVACEGYREFRSRTFQWEVGRMFCTPVELGELPLEAVGTAAP